MLGSDFDIPGLDDLAQTVGDDELEESTSKPKALDSNLPFGLGAESSITKSSLPLELKLGAQFSPLVEDSYDGGKIRIWNLRNRNFQK